MPCKCSILLPVNALKRIQDGLPVGRSHQAAYRTHKMNLGIALHLAMLEEPSVRMDWVCRFYDMLSLQQVTMATPTLANARKPYHQLSSCFIDTVPDSLDGIYRSLDSFAKVSKWGGGMGLYFGKVRAIGAAIRDFEGAAGGVIRWIRLVNDTAVAVDQLGVRRLPRCLAQGPAGVPAAAHQQWR